MHKTDTAVVHQTMLTKSEQLKITNKTTKKCLEIFKGK